MPSWVVTLLLQDDALTLNRAVGIVRRRNIPVTSVSLGPTTRAGVSRLTTILSTDQSAVVRMANALRKMVGVLEVTLVPESECLVREQALIRLRPPARELARLLDVAALYQASVLQEQGNELLLEVTGSPPGLVSLLRALEPFGVVDVVRSGAVVLPRSSISDSAERAPVPPASRVASAVPA